MAAVTVLMGSLAGGVPVIARSPEDKDWPVKVNMEPNAVIQKQFIVNTIKPTYNGYTYDFTGTDPNFIILNKARYGIWNAYLAAYDYNKVTQTEVESRITELGETGGNPSWAKWTHNMIWGREYGVSSGTTNFGSNDGKLIGEAPGVLYYGLQLRDNKNSFDDPEYFWVYGKLDFRACAYINEEDPHIAQDCRVSISRDGKHYEYTPIGTDKRNPDTYVEWGEEWSMILNERLDKLETDILAWTGDEEAEQGFRAQFQDTRTTAADADEETQILTTVDRLEELLRSRTVEVEEQKRLEEKQRLEEERKRLEEERKQLEEEQQRLEEEKKKQEEERKQLEEEKEKQEEEQKRLEEERKQLAEEQKRLEEEKKKQEEEWKRLEEEQKHQEEEKKKQESSNRPSESRPIVDAAQEGVDQGDNAGMGSINTNENELDGDKKTEVVGTDSMIGNNVAFATVVEQQNGSSSQVDTESMTENKVGAMVEVSQKDDNAEKMENLDEIELPALQSTAVGWKMWPWLLLALFILALGTVLYGMRKKLQKQ